MPFEAGIVQRRKIKSDLASFSLPSVLTAVTKTPFLLSEEVDTKLFQCFSVQYG